MVEHVSDSRPIGLTRRQAITSMGVAAVGLTALGSADAEARPGIDDDGNGLIVVPGMCN